MNFKVVEREFMFASPQSAIGVTAHSFASFPITAFFDTTHTLFFLTMHSQKKKTLTGHALSATGWRKARGFQEFNRTPGVEFFISL